VFVAVWSAPALVAYCVAVAAEFAPWSVDASWLSSCACPEPPDPAGSWYCEASWVVKAKFPANEAPELSAVWSPPALVAFCVAVAAEFAYWLVSADWLRSCAWPEPPEPRPPLPAIWVWSALWQVAAALTAAEAAEFVAVWSAPALVASCVAVAAESAPCSVDASCSGPGPVPRHRIQPDPGTARHPA